MDNYYLKYLKYKMKYPGNPELQALARWSS